MAETEERPLSARPAYSARPSVRVDGQALATVDQLLRTMTVVEAEGGLSSLTLRLGNWGIAGGSADYVFDAGGPIGFGTRLEVYAGDTGSPRKIFDGRVHAIEGAYSTGAAPEVVFLAEDGLYAARLARRTAVWEDRALQDVAQDIATRHGLTLDASGLPNERALYAQVEESDLAFLRRIAARVDCDFQLVDTTLQLRRRADQDRGTIDLSLYGQLLEMRATADLAAQVTLVSASGFDTGSGRAYNVQSTGTQATSAGARAGADVLRDLAERREHLGALSTRSETEAQALADAAFDRRARRFVRVQGTTEGNAALRVGTRVRIRGTGRRFDNIYAVIEARHRFDAVSGYRTDFIGESGSMPEA